MNILQNAIEALEAKLESNHDTDFKPTIWISSKVNDAGKIMITIKDNGIGINKNHQERIFEPFFTTKSAKQGTGLSLYTSYQIITDIHKGSLIYNDCPEGGSEFIIELPIPEDQ